MNEEATSKELMSNLKSLLYDGEELEREEGDMMRENRKEGRKKTQRWEKESESG